jgi:hypothetical protein
MVAWPLHTLQTLVQAVLPCTVLKMPSVTSQVTSTSALYSGKPMSFHEVLSHCSLGWQGRDWCYR